MSVTPSFSSDVVYISNLPTPDSLNTDLERKTIFFGGRSYEVIDNKIGLSTNPFNEAVNIACKIAMNTLPILGIGAAVAMFLCPVHFISACLITSVTSLSLFLIKEHILKFTKESFPYFTVRDVENTRKELLKEPYIAGTLTDLAKRHHHNLNHLTAYLTPEELVKVFKKELKSYPLDQSIEHFNLNVSYNLRKMLQEAFIDHLSEVYAPYTEGDLIVERESEAVKGIIGYIKAYNKGQSIPSPTLLGKFSLIPYYLKQYIDFLAPIENRESSETQTKNLLSDRLLN